MSFFGFVNPAQDGHSTEVLCAKICTLAGDPRKFALSLPLRVVKVLAKNFGMGQWSIIGPGSEKKLYSGEENSPQGAWDHIADEMLLEFAESGHPIFRATTPLSRDILKSEGHGKLSIHFTADSTWWRRTCGPLTCCRRHLLPVSPQTLPGCWSNIACSADPLLPPIDRDCDSKDVVWNFLW